MPPFRPAVKTFEGYESCNNQFKRVFPDTVAIIWFGHGRIIFLREQLRYSVAPTSNKKPKLSLLKGLDRLRMLRRALLRRLCPIWQLPRHERPHCLDVHGVQRNCLESTSIVHICIYRITHICYIVRYEILRILFVYNIHFTLSICNGSVFPPGFPGSQRQVARSRDGSFGGCCLEWSRMEGHGAMGDMDGFEEIISRWFKVTFSGWLSDPFKG